MVYFIYTGEECVLKWKECKSLYQYSTFIYLLFYAGVCFYKWLYKKNENNISH